MTVASFQRLGAVLTASLRESEFPTNFQIGNDEQLKPDVKPPEAPATPAAVVRLPELPTSTLRGQQRRTQREIILRRWECTVSSVSRENFIATLRPVFPKDDEMEAEAEIPIEEVTPDDRELLKPGALFYWTVGYNISPSGTRRRASELVFRRLPAWTKKEVELVRRRGADLFARFGKRDA